VYITFFKNRNHIVIYEIFDINTSEDVINVSLGIIIVLVFCGISMDTIYCLGGNYYIYNCYQF
jgi:hypothetical protein